MPLFSLANLVRAHPWNRAVFTTYALSLTFFEAVVLDELIRGGTREALVLADVQGIRSAVSELGARRVGRDYQVEPVAVTGGVFHPKIAVLSSATETHLVVGSGNLTFGGWGGNLEAFEHLHAGFATDALADAAGFFETLAYEKQVRHEAAADCLRVADDLMRAAMAGPQSSGRVRLFHNFGRSIAEQLGDMAADLGGAVRLAVVSPFWDGGTGIDRLCAALRLDHAYVHAHPAGTVQGRLGTAWPVRPRVTVEAVQVEALEDLGAGRPRPLHAKLFEVSCQRGRILVSGSANATMAALGGSNVEACVVRLQKDTVSGWRWSPALPLAAVASESDDKAGEPLAGILRAVLNGDGLSGRVLSGDLRGDVSAVIVSAEGPRPLGEAQVADDGGFSLKAPGLELEGWKGARLVLRLEGGGCTAEGFVSQAAIGEISRRAGPIASRLFAVLSGTDTPADAAAIMAWANENADRLRQAQSRTAGGSGQDGARLDSTAVLARLLSVPAHAYTDAGAAGDEPAANWRRFIEAFLSQFRKPRRAAPGASDGGDDDIEEGASTRHAAMRTDQVCKPGELDNFDRVFNMLAGGPRGCVELAHSLTLGIIHRLRPDAQTARRYLLSLVHALSEGAMRDEFRAEAAAALLVALALEVERDGAEADRRARLRALRMGLDPDGPPPDDMPTDGFRDYLAPAADLGALWVRLGKVRTMSEQVRSYVADLRSGRLAGDYPDLRGDPQLWPALERAVTGAGSRGSVVVVPRGTDACPRHWLGLPAREAQSLRVRGIGRALDCCGCVLVCEEA